MHLEAKDLFSHQLYKLAEKVKYAHPSFHHRLKCIIKSKLSAVKPTPWKILISTKNSLANPFKIHPFTTHARKKSSDLPIYCIGAQKAGTTWLADAFTPRSLEPRN